MTKLDWLRDRLERRWFPWAVVGLLAALTPVAGILAAVATAADHRDAPPPCYGIGWGCTLSPTTAGMLFGLTWIVAVVAISLVLALTELFWRRVASLRSFWLLVILGLAVALLLVFVVHTLVDLF